jgi:5'-nucleotidase (lipoprotein e(P4) family)
MRRTGVVAVALAVAGLAGTGTRAQAPAARDTHENLHAVLWVQTAAEYQAIARGLYRLAGEQLDRALENRRWTAIPEQAGRADLPALPPAVILDADETILDNSADEGQRVLDHVGWDADRFARWALRAQAGSVPGAVDFLHYAASRDVQVFVVTNRDPKWRDATIENLKKNGVVLPASQVLCWGEYGRGADAGDKSGRRQFVAASHRVLLLVGDDLGDFVSLSDARGTLDRGGRAALIDRFSGYWEQRWIVMPNPMYGSWVRAVVPSATSDADALKQQFQSVRGIPE